VSVAKELERKAVHVFAMLIPFGCYLLPSTVVMAGLLTASVVMLAIEYGRLENRRVANVFKRFFGSVIREHESFSFTGSTFVLVGSLCTYYLFEPKIAAAALSFLLLGDAAAAVVGKAFGSYRLFGKSFEGFVAMLGVSWLIGIVFVSTTLAAYGAVAAAIIEFLPIPLDDNLRIPLAAGAVMTLIGG
jgi:dolichol kinase